MQFLLFCLWASSQPSTSDSPTPTLLGDLSQLVQLSEETQNREKHGVVTESTNSLPVYNTTDTAT